MSAAKTQMKSRRLPVAPQRAGHAKHETEPSHDSSSPNIVREEPMDSEYFASGGIPDSQTNNSSEPKYANVKVRDSDVEKAPDSPTLAIKKARFVRVDDIEGTRREPPRPRPVKQMSNRLTRETSKRAAAVKSRKSAVVELSDEDEGYGSYNAENVTSETGNGFFDIEATEDDADENGNLAGFVVNDDVEEDDTDNEQAEAASNMDEEPDNLKEGTYSEDFTMHDEQPDEDLERRRSASSSPMPERLTSPVHIVSKKRRQADLSEDEDVRKPVKRHLSKQQNSQRALPKEVVAGKRTAKPEAQRKNKNVKQHPSHNASKTKQQRGSKIEPGNAVESAVAPESERPSDKKAGEKAATPDKPPEERGCEVTHESKQCELLIGTYLHAPILKNHHFDSSYEIEYADVGVMTDTDIFPEGLNVEHLRKFLSLARIPSGFIGNPARDIPEDYHFRTSGQSQTLSFKKGGDHADILVFGFVTKSEVKTGREYNASGQTRLLKNVEVNLIAQEGERMLAMISMVGGGKKATLLNAEGGSVTFSTKHTPVDEYGDEIKKSVSGKLTASFIRKNGSTSARTGRVHTDIVRRTREGTETIPVFDSRNHLYSTDTVDPEEVLTQRGRVDPLWNKEIPVGAFVAVHSTVNLYYHQKQKTKAVSFNLSAIQILALPLQQDA
ncbi:unnamed protein product [Peniophora sp. CBMAI 1063]|nr:unnamed protein product [Peniophora sp. CBMAI 1063]